MSATTTTTKTAFRHQCLNARSGLCTRGNGKPKRKRCGYCGSSLLVLSGVWACFEWRGDGRYYLDDALSTHATEAAARRAAERDPDKLVWRFVIGEAS